MEETLLVELQTEELPPKALSRISEAFANEIFNGLVHYQLKLRELSGWRVYGTPRRLAVLIPRVLSTSVDREVEVSGPSTKAAPTAIAGFAKKHRVDESALTEKQTPKGTVYVATIVVKGVSLDAVLAKIVSDATKRLSVPKVMRWGSSESQFVRPVHGLVLLHGNRLVPGRVLELESKSETLGHRFIGSRKIILRNADEYEARLRLEGMVIANFDDRKFEIENQLQNAALRLGANLGDYKKLLDEVTALVEFPSVYVGAFDSSYLDVPHECLILTMQQNQKYFPLFDASKNLLPKFLIVSNMKIDDPANIIAGNQRVIRPRLEDARFFYNQDRKVRLEARVPQLASVVFHNKLGSQLQRVERIQRLAERIVRTLKADVALVERASLLCKADLLTGMVGEFPELQGIMGRYYALHDNEPASIANAMEEHYRPRFAGDELPNGPISCSVALADKLDMIVGLFGIGEIPTGEKDPFALRRHALGVLRILSERKLKLELNTLLKWAHEQFPNGVLLDSHQRAGVSVPNHVEVGFFVRERARNYLRDLGYSVLELEAVLDLDPNPVEYVSRLEAVRAFLMLPESAGLAEADKRIRNILSKSGGESIVHRADESKFEVEPEKQLLRTARLLRTQVDELVGKDKFKDALLLTAQIHQPVTAFFEKVMVNVSDKTIQTNRFALLHEVIDLTNRVANISRLAI